MNNHSNPILIYSKLDFICFKQKSFLVKSYVLKTFSCIKSEIPYFLLLSKSIIYLYNFFVQVICTSLKGNAYQGAASLTVTAESLWRCYFLYDGRHYRNHHTLNGMMIWCHISLHLRYRQHHHPVVVVVSRYL